MDKTRLLLIASLFALSAVADVTPEKLAWSKGPVQYLMTLDEISTWNAVTSNEQADAFVASFWARRDPTPGTPANEFQEEFDRRVAYADANFHTPKLRGALTERGKIWILFGKPSRTSKSAGDGPASNRRPTASTEVMGTVAIGDPYSDDNADREAWVYEGPYATAVFGRPTVELKFIDRFKDRFYEMEPTRVDLDAARMRVINASRSATSLKLQSDTLESALADIRSGKLGGTSGRLTYAEFLSPSGEYYVPIGIIVPAATEADTFFGVIEDNAGKRIGSFEQPAKGVTSTQSSIYDATFSLPTGKYIATFGLAKNGVPVVATSGPVDVQVVEKDAKGTSRLILTDIVETEESAPPKTPFAFGKLKLVPRTSFAASDTLRYFLEIHNPGIDAATILPRMQAKVELVPPTGPPIAATMEIHPLPIGGTTGPGQYALISSIPLGAMKSLAPGDYTLRLRVLDQVTNKSYSVEQKLKIVG
jgi:GWxTD domain-containing protein